MARQPKPPLTPKQQRQRNRENAQGRLKRTFGFVPAKPPEFALPDSDDPHTWPLNDAMVRAFAKDKRTPSVMAYRQFQASGYPQPMMEFQFNAPDRKWAFDFCWQERMIAVEVEGLWGRHQTVAGMTDDAIKYAIAAIDGWLVIRATTKMVQDGTMLAILELAWKADRNTVTAQPT